MNLSDKIFKEKEKYIDSGCLFYRARKIEREKVDSKKIGTKFAGYDAEGSFVNLINKWPSIGRMNPQGVYVLYVASDVRTAITELHPYAMELYSVAKINTKNQLRIADLSQSSSGNTDDFTRNASLIVQEWLSQRSSEDEYIFPQYVAAYCKSNGYDGIGFRSKYALKADIRENKGINYAIFNYNKCEAISSIVHTVNKISVSIEEYGELFK